MSLQLEDYIGAVPLIISLSDTDCTVQGKPAPLAYVLPRSSVLMSLRREVQNFYSAYTVVKADATPLVWLTWRGEPIPWHYPVGAIKDSINAVMILEQNETPRRVSHTEASQSSSLSPAEMYPAVFASPLMLEVRITCVSAERPLTVPTPGQEDPNSRHSADQAIGEFLKQMIKGTFSLMYGSIKALMDARSEVINDLLSFAMCMTTGDPFVQAMRAYNERIVGLRRLAGEPKNIAVMINIPVGKSPLHFGLFRVPLMTSGICDDKSGTQNENKETKLVAEMKSNNDCSNNESRSAGDSYAALSDDVEQKSQPLDTSLGVIIWRALLEPYVRWCRRSRDSASTPTPADPFLQALSPFYDGLDINLSSSVLFASSRAEALVNDFIAAGDAATRGDAGIDVTVPTPAPQKHRLCFVVQGLQPPFSTPVGYLLHRFASADCRLYVTMTAL